MVRPQLRLFVIAFGFTLLPPLVAQNAKPDRAIQVRPPTQASLDGERRLALVIGNGAYASAPLRNPVNDARAVAEHLRLCHFDVVSLENATRAQMREAVRAFGARIAKGGVGLFYFAGHGMQVKGRNYLVPVDADIAQEDEVAGEALEVDAVLAKMETARNRLNIMILDACRNNPFGRSFRSTLQGLAQVDAPTGTFVAFATSPGRSAADGNGDHGLYTQALLHQFLVPGLKLEEVFKRTRAEVLAASDQQQTPWENSSIVGDFYFLPGNAQVEMPPMPAPVSGSVITAVKRAPAPTPEEARLLDLMREKGKLPEKRRMARLLAAKGSIYGIWAAGSLNEDATVHNRAVTAAAKQGIPPAMVELAEFLVERPVSPGDLTEARAWLERAAAFGDPDAKLVLGSHLMGDKLGPHDLPRSERLMAEAAQAGPVFCYGVGCAYWDMAKDSVLPKADADAKGLAFLRRGADLGDVGCMSMLASAYQTGDHAAQNLGEARYWHLETQKHDPDPYWLVSIGRFYRDVTDPAFQSGPDALEWLGKGAEKGFLGAYADMAEIYRAGALVPKDLARALALHRKAADRGFRDSRRALGEMYENGEGVPKDAAQAYYWFLLAEDKEERTRLAPSIPAEERKRLEALAKKQKPVRDN